MPYTACGKPAGITTDSPSCKMYLMPSIVISPSPSKQVTNASPPLLWELISSPLSKEKSVTLKASFWANVLDNLEIAQQTNPMNYLDGDIPPILIAHGTKDRLVAFKQSVKLYKTLKEKNKEVVFYRMKGADHGGPMFFCEEMLDEVVKFIRKVKYNV